MHRALRTIALVAGAWTLLVGAWGLVEALVGTVEADELAEQMAWIASALLTTGIAAIALALREFQGRRTTL